MVCVRVRVCVCVCVDRVYLRRIGVHFRVESIGEARNELLN